MQRITIDEVEPLTGHRLRLIFSDGFEKVHDVEPLIERGGALFGPLRDKAMFDQVSIDPVSGTVCWPNGADLDPYVLRGKIPNLHGGKRAGAGRKPNEEQTELVSMRLPVNVVAAIKSETGEKSAGKALQKWVMSKSPRRIRSRTPGSPGKRASSTPRRRQKLS